MAEAAPSSSASSALLSSETPYKSASDYGTSAAADAPAKRAKPAGHAYREDIDGLRAFALLGVVIFHVDPTWLEGGFLGVDCFFVISGFVVSQSILNGPQPSACAFFAAFYARRLKRLTTALCLFAMVIATFIPLLFGLSHEVTDENLQDYYLSGQLATFGAANILYSTQRATYWDTTLKSRDFNPFLHCWSLGVEEQFYLLFPLMLLALYPIYLTSKGAATKASETGSCIPFTALLALAIISFGAALILCLMEAPWSLSAVPSEQRALEANLVFYASPFRFWQLASGALLQTAVRSHATSFACVQKALPAPLLSTVSFVTLVVCFICSKGSNDDIIQLLYALLTILATLCFLIAGMPPPTPAEPPAKGIPPILLFNYLCTTSPARYIGKISYQLYLWHWPAILFTRQLGDNGGSVGSQVLLAVSLGLLAPAFSYHVAEYPLRASWGPFPMKTLRDHLCTLVAMLTLIGVSAAYIGWVSGPLGETLISAVSPVHTPSCPAMSTRSAFYDYIAEGTGNMATPTALGRNLHPSRHLACACRYCDGVNTPNHAPRHVSLDESDSLCFSTYAGNLNHRDDDCGISLPTTPTTEEVDSYKALYDRCLAPDRNNPDLPHRTLFLIGDSLSASLRPGVLLAVRGAYQVRSFHQTFHGMLMSEERLASVVHSRNQETSDALRELYEHLKTVLALHMRKGDVLAILEQDIMFMPLMSGNATILALEQEILLPIVQAVNASLLVFGGWPRADNTLPTPSFPKDVYARAEVAHSLRDTMFTRHDRCEGNYTACPPYSRPHFISLFESYCDGPLPNYTELNALPRPLPDNQTFVPNCWNTLPGVPINGYADGAHLNTVGSVYMWPYICDAMEDVALL